MMRTLLARPPSAMGSGLPVPSIIVTAPDEATPTTPRFFMHRAHPAAVDTNLLQVPRRVSTRQQQQQQQHQQQLLQLQQRPRTTTTLQLHSHVTTPLIKFDKPPPRLARHRPQPIPLPEPIEVVQEDNNNNNNTTTNGNNSNLPSPTMRAVFDTLKGLEKYCESLVVSARTRPTDNLVEPTAPKPVASTTAFKKSHRRVHSVDISSNWNRGRPGVATPQTQRRKRSISNHEDVLIGVPKATLARSERSMALSRRLAMSRTTCAVLPDLIEDVHQTAPVARTRPHTQAVSPRPLPKSRTMSLDERLANLLRAPQPTVLSNRSGRADLTSLFGAVSAAGTPQHANNANLALLPEGLELMPAATLAVGYYATLSKNAASLGQKVRRYITV